MLAALMPDEPEVHGLLALMLCHDARRGARFAGGELVLDDYRYLHSTRAELLRRLGRDGAARAAYERAIALTGAGPERRFLERRLAELRPGSPAPRRP